MRAGSMLGLTPGETAMMADRDTSPNTSRCAGKEPPRHSKCAIANRDFRLTQRWRKRPMQGERC
jgi:hypothetical protein